MNDQPSEAALRKACEVLGWANCAYANGSDIHCAIQHLARHFATEDKAAWEAITSLWPEQRLIDFARRHILPDPKPTVIDVVERWRGTPGRTTEALETLLRDAGLLKEPS